MHNQTKRIVGSWPLLIAIATTLPSLAVALEDIPLQYEIEVIAFRHADRSSSTAEAIASGQPSLSDTDQESLDPGMGAATTGQGPAALRNSQQFSPLARGQFQLASIYQRLQKLDAYAPLLHTGWIQQARSTDEAAPRRLGNNAGRAELAGTVTLYKKRFLHVNVDMALGSPGTGALPQDRVFSDIAVGNAPTDLSRRLRESRRIRQEDINYFDHPEFGVIVSVREVAENTPSSADGND